LLWAASILFFLRVLDFIFEFHMDCGFPLVPVLFRSDPSFPFNIQVLLEKFSEHLLGRIIMFPAAATHKVSLGLKIFWIRQVFLVHHSLKTLRIYWRWV